MAEQVEDLTSVSFDYHYSFPAEQVWSVLTSPGLFGQWVKDFEATKYETGLPFSFNVFPFLGTGFVGGIDGRFMNVRVNETLAYRLATRDGAIAIDSSWRLRPDNDGTQLVVDATGFDPDDVEQMRFRQLCVVGWPTVLSHVDAILREGAATR